MTTAASPPATAAPATAVRAIALPPLSGALAWSVAGIAAYLACQGGMIVLLARAGSSGQVGQFALGMAVGAPVLLLTNLGLRRVMSADVDGRFAFADYLGLRLLAGAAALVAVAGIAAVAGWRAETAVVVVLIGAAKVVESVSDVTYGLFQRHERQRRIAASLALRGAAALGGLCVGLRLSGGAAGAAAGMGLGWLAVLIAHDLPNAARLLREAGEGDVRPRWRRTALAPLLGRAWPLGLVAMLAALAASIPCLIIERRLGEAALGVYAALAYFHVAGNRVVSALGEASSARLARHFAAGDARAFARVAVRVGAAALLLGAAGLALALAAAGPGLALLYGPGWAAHAPLLTAMLAVTVLVNLHTVLDYAMTATGRFAVQPVLYGAAAAVYAALCWAWIPADGLPGAVQALAAATVVQSGAVLAVVLHAFGAGRGGAA